MAADKPSPKFKSSARFTRLPASPSSSRPPYRFALRILVIPVVAVVGVFIYSGIRDRLVLPECDSERAKKSLAEVLQQFKYEPTTYAPVKTVSATKDQVVCSAVLALPDGGYVAADFTFYWEGDKANMKYSVARKATDDSPITPPLR
ncbi:MAG TPA: hypothetical protein VK591_16240 [Xanthobacteraceae bacterium]|nr:hypothetical protein [Xanthobacteraceae bacterium]